MNEDRHERLKEIFLSASRLESGKRELYLDAACDTDPELRREVDAMLLHDSAPIDLKTNGRQFIAVALGDTGSVANVFDKSNLANLVLDTQPTNGIVMGDLSFNGQLSSSGDLPRSGDILMESGLT